MSDRSSVLQGPEWVRVNQRLVDELDDLTDHVLTRVRSELSGYAEVPIAVLRHGVRENLRRAMGVLEHGGRPTPDELNAAGRTATLRGEQGVPVGDVLRAWRLAAYELWMAHRRIAEEFGVGQSAQLQVMQLIHEGVDQGLDAAVAGHRRADMRRNRIDIAQRARLLRSLVLGTSTAADMDLLTSGYRLAPDTAFRAVRCRPANDAQAAAAERALAAEGTGLVELVDHELLGVVSASTTVQLTIPAGLGSPTTPAELPHSFAEAAVALATSTAFGIVGVVTVAELGAKVAVVTRPEIGARLAARFVAPLRAAGSTGADALDTVAEHLRNGLRVNRTARAMYVHPNTVRHRLRRFELATGAQLDDIEDVVGVWWALRHREIHPDPLTD